MALVPVPQSLRLKDTWMFLELAFEQQLRRCSYCMGCSVFNCAQDGRRITRPQCALWWIRTTSVSAKMEQLKLPWWKSVLTLFADLSLVRVRCCFNFIGLTQESTREKSGPSCGNEQPYYHRESSYKARKYHLGHFEWEFQKTQVPFIR